MNTDREKSHMVRSLLTTVCTLMCWVCVGIRSGSSETYHYISPHDGEYSFSVGGNGAFDDTHAIYFSSPGNETLVVAVGLDGPQGLTGSIDAVSIPGASPISPAHFTDSNSLEKLKVIAPTQAGFREYERFMIDGADGIVRFFYQIHKDACRSDKEVKYLSRVVLNFAGVAQERLAEGVTVRIAMQEYHHAGSKVASIKPVAEGMYRGEPILLMGATQYGGEYVNVIRRGKNGRIQSKRRIPIVKYVYHRGHTLSLARLRGILRGGKATFELSNGAAIYGVCFELVRRRQVANGYPL